MRMKQFSFVFLELIFSVCILYNVDILSFTCFVFFQRYYNMATDIKHSRKKGKKKVQGMPQSQTAAHPRPQEEEETDKSKQAQTYEKH